MKALSGRREPKCVRVILAGLGHVGRSLAGLLAQKESELRQRYGLSYRVVAAVTGSHGSTIQPDGVPLELLSRRGVLGPQRDTLDIIRSVPADVLVELTPLEITAGQPARSHIEQALRRGMHVVTANKGPIAFAYRQLAALAQAQGVRLLFESTVMDGTPVFNLARHGLLGATVAGFRGVLNSTTNFILGELETGGSFDEAVAEARRRGFAEADASLDIEGWDAAFKTTVLANVLLRGDVLPGDILREGIGDITRDDVAVALAAGERIKLLCEARREGPAVVGRVVPLRIPFADPLANVGATSSILTLETDLMGDITIVEHDPTLEQTAYGVLNDLLELASSHAN